ncbi:hypothetical protein BKA67DRAFT_539368 [Truncatella angustata]|uniref:Uncharacterized protein n=1 Tax=Truncatella angustata TaxID=152316 RepID=A0A9P8UAN3_9PEZI|nr:uncharacterized protein BKA67DRAFT_539368 [Truncatella angustata]KAH6647511.1 hypothetical protein BKA67DRAFT_539368 [Truncatella angustata]
MYIWSHHDGVHRRRRRRRRRRREEGCSPGSRATTVAMRSVTPQCHEETPSLSRRSMMESGMAPLLESWLELATLEVDVDYCASGCLVTWYDTMALVEAWTGNSSHLVREIGENPGDWGVVVAASPPQVNSTWPLSISPSPGTPLAMPTIIHVWHITKCGRLARKYGAPTLNTFAEYPARKRVANHLGVTATLGAVAPPSSGSGSKVMAAFARKLSFSGPHL